MGRGTGRQVSSGPETLPRLLGWPSSSLWPGLLPLPMCPLTPGSVSCSLCFSCSGDTGSAPRLDGAGQQLATAWLSHSLRVSVPPVGRTFYREGSLGSEEE